MASSERGPSQASALPAGSGSAAAAASSIDTGPAAFEFGAFTLVPAARQLLLNARPVRIGSRALDLLVALVERAGEVVTTDELFTRAWPNTVVEPGSLPVQVAAIRRMLSLGAGRDAIVTVVGKGYCFAAIVKRLPAERREAQGGMPGAAVSTPVGSPASPRGSPALATRVIGRDAAIAQVVGRSRSTRCVSIVGPAGVGKTTMAIAAARELVTAESGLSYCYVSLESVADAALVPATVAAALDIALEARDPLRGLAIRLRDMRLLIVLDNCEHLVAGASALVERLISEAPGVLFLITSRQPLRSEVESVYRLQPLEVPSATRGFDVGQAMKFSAVELFVERATAWSGFTLNDEDVAPVVEICRRLDGLPLAIEMAAASVEQVGVLELVSQVEDRITALGRGRRLALPRQQTLEATLDWSFALLSRSEQRLLCRLSVFRCSFTLTDAVAVGVETATAAAEVATWLAHLVSISLVVVDVSRAPVDYRLLETTRAYASRRLSAGADRNPTAARHARWLCQTLQSTATEVESKGVGHWTQRHARHLSDVRACLDWSFSAEGDRLLGIQLAAASAPLWFAMSLMAEYEHFAESALSAIPGTRFAGSELEISLLEARGHVLWHSGASAPAMSGSFSAALELAQAAGLTKYQLQALWGLWVICASNALYDGAVTLARRYGDIAAAHQDRGAELIHSRMMALGLHYLGHHEEALPHARRVLVEANVAGSASVNGGLHLDQRVAALAVLARTLWIHGFPDQAMEHAREAVAESLRRGHALTLCYALANGAAPVALWCGNVPAARHYVNLLQEHATEQSANYWLGFARGYKAALIRTGEWDPADEPEQWVPSECRPIVRETVSTVNATLADEGTLAQSVTQTEGWALPELLRVSALRASQRDGGIASQSAESAIMRSLAVAQRQKARSWELRSALAWAEMTRGTPKHSDGVVLLDKAFKQFSEGFQTTDLRRARAALGDA